MTPIRPDDKHSARAWAAFVADDKAAAAPPSLEARVLLAAHAALAQQQRVDAERVRRRWFAGISAIAASLLAAAAWSLAPGGMTASRGPSCGSEITWPSWLLTLFHVFSRSATSPRSKSSLNNTGFAFDNP